MIFKDETMNQNNQKKPRFHHRRRPARQAAPHGTPAATPAENGGETIASQPNTDAGQEELLTVQTPPQKESDPEPEEIREKVEEDTQNTLCVVGVRFRPVGKTYSFDPQDLALSAGDEVVVETGQGPEFATVSAPRRMVRQSDVVLPLRKVLRYAADKDIKRNEDNKALEQRAKKVFWEKVEQHGLEMALSDVECNFERTKLIFYFTSEGRVDFREFVKDMAGVFKMRIELRQIGVRDEARQLGGLGICGRPLCCNQFLNDFQQVSIKMAKEQNLSLNPTKISGTCGRLMCCLRYENDVYVEAGKTCPRADCTVMTPQGRGTVVESNLLCGKCRVRLDADPENIVPYSAEELKILPKQKKNAPNQKEENRESAEDAAKE